MSHIKNNGLSAYEIGVSHGFTGTEQQWLDSLKGLTGNTGAQGIQGIPGITKRIDLYSGNTDSNGNYSVVYGTPFAVTPHVEPQLIPSSNANMSCRVTSSTINGFTVKAEQKTSLTVLTLNVASFDASNLANAAISVVVIER